MTRNSTLDGDGGGVHGVVVRDDGDPPCEAVQPAARGDLRVRPQRRPRVEVLLGTGKDRDFDIWTSPSNKVTLQVLIWSLVDFGIPLIGKPLTY